jgi:hypothetical protein
MHIAGKTLLTWNTCSTQAKLSPKTLRTLHSTILPKNTSADGCGHSMTSKGEHIISHVVAAATAMVKRCVVAGCSNTHADGVSLFKFPVDKLMRRKWIRQIQSTRAKWTATETSLICSQHFTENCFEQSSILSSNTAI